MRSPVSTSTKLRLGIAVPIGAWDARLPFALESINRCSSVSVALVDASQDPRVLEAADKSGLSFTYRRHGPDKGQSAAIQEGWDNLPDADVLAWLNADDFLFADGVESALKVMGSRPNLDVYYTSSTITDEQGSTVGVHPKIDSDPSSLLKSCTISQPSCFVRKTAIQAVGGLDLDLDYTMDWDLWARLYQAGFHFEYEPGFASAVYWGKGTKTNSFGLDRLSEIARLTARLSDRLQAVKAMMGMVIHHCGDVLAENSAAQVMITPEAPLNLSVPNLTHHDSSHLIVELEGNADCLNVVSKCTKMAKHPKGIQLEFGHFTQPGDYVSIQLKSTAAIRLSRCRWNNHSQDEAQ